MPTRPVCRILVRLLLALAAWTALVLFVVFRLLMRDPVAEAEESAWAVCDQRARCRRDCAAHPLQEGCCTADLLRLVQYVRAASDSYADALPLVAIAGTLLGGVRDRGIILPWTADVDLGVFERDLPHLRAALQRDPRVAVFLGGTIWRVCLAAPPGPATIVEPRVSTHNKIAYMDLFLLHDAARGGGVNMGDLPCNPFPREMVYPLRDHALCLYNQTDACLDLMAQPERYLHHLYGPKWREPPTAAQRMLHGRGQHRCYLRNTLAGGGD
jgi:hypothetical protein